MSLGTVSKLVLGFVTIILGAVLIGSIATNGLLVTQKKSLTNEAVDISSARNALGNIDESVEITVANAPTSWKQADCPLTSVTYGNASEDYTITTDYLITLSTGILTLKNTTTVIDGTNDTLIDYTYCGDDYLNLSWGRTLVNIVSGFFAIAILLVGLGLFYSVAKDTGILK